MYEYLGCTVMERTLVSLGMYCQITNTGEIKKKIFPLLHLRKALMFCMELAAFIV
jgi:hypothetical protein